MKKRPSAIAIADQKSFMIFSESSK